MYSGDVFYLSAFFELSTTRQYGTAIGPIPWHRIIEYGKYLGLDPRMMGVFVQVIRRLDQVWMAWQSHNNRSPAPDSP